MNERFARKVTKKASKAFLLLLSALLIPVLGYCFKYALIFYRTIYPEVYMRTIVARTETPASIPAHEKLYLIFQETWPIIIVITILGSLMLIAAFTVIREIVIFLTRK